jgi:hypothetical protein
MVELSLFTPEEQKLLISLPYQAGINISDSDGSGGQENDALELEALYRVLGLLPGLYNNAPLTQDILRQTKEHQAEWSQWKEGSFDLTRECRAAIDLLKKKAGEAEARAYRKAILDVAEAVARAAGEHNGMVEVRQEPDSALFKFLKKAMTFLGLIKKDDLSNISASEQEAIDRLAAALTV